MPRLYTEEEVAQLLNKSRRGLLDWLRDNPAPPSAGRPYYVQLGRNKRFTDEDVVRILRAMNVKKPCGKPHEEEAGAIYFADNGDHIKIGFTRTEKSLQSRMKQMRTHAPNGVTILHIEAGTGYDEKMLHHQFASLRLRGEWFRKGPELLAHIEQRKTLTHYTCGTHR